MAIVNDMRVPQNEYQLGRTKMFLRSPETLFGQFFLWGGGGTIWVGQGGSAVLETDL